MSERVNYLVFYMGEKEGEDWHSFDSFIYHAEKPITTQTDLDRLKSVIKKKTKWRNIVVRDLILLKGEGGTSD